jgi:hypothetical protein
VVQHQVLREAMSVVWTLLLLLLPLLSSSSPQPPPSATRHARRRRQNLNTPGQSTRNVSRQL